MSCLLSSWLNFVNYKVKCFQQNSTKCMTRIATREGQEVGWKCSQEHLCQLSGKQLKSDNLSVRLSDGGLCSGRWWAVSWYPRSRIVGEGTSPESRPPIIVAWTASFFLHQSWGPPWGLFYFKYFWLKTLNSPQIDQNFIDGPIGRSVFSISKFKWPVVHKTQLQLFEAAKKRIV